jgi:hypothetical protein
MAPKVFSWNFPGAYAVQFMTVVSCTACVYTCYHFLVKNPDVHFVKELKQDELAESQRWAQQAKAVQGNVFRWLAHTRDTAAGEQKDSRIFRM